MNIAIYEDDYSFAGQLELYISRYTHFPPALNTGRPDALERYLTATIQPTLFFLDIVLEGANLGLTAAARISERKLGDMIVFLTAYRDRIIGNPVYLTISFSVIFKDSLTLYQEVAATIDIARAALAGKCLLRSIGKYENLYIPFDSILFIEHVKGRNKVCIRCADGRYTVCDTLTAIHAQLDGRFVRCHHAYIVNRDKIIKIDKTTKTVYLAGGSSCPYSQTMKRNLFS